MVGHTARMVEKFKEISNSIVSNKEIQIPVSFGKK